VYGQESKDFAKFVPNGLLKNSKRKRKMIIKIPETSIDTQKNKLCKYLSKNIPKYKSIVIQEYIKGFDKENPEIRCYFLNGQYVYSVVTTSTKVETPVQEGGRYKIPPNKWRYIKRFSKKVMEALPKINLKFSKASILTRIDIGSGLDNVPHGYFVNEIEFVPSLYIEDQNYPVVEQIAKSLLFVAFEYYYSKLPIKVTF